MKLRIIQRVYFQHRQLQVGDVIEVDRADLPDGEVPYWAVAELDLGAEDISPRGFYAALMDNVELQEKSTQE